MEEKRRDEQLARVVVYVKQRRACHGRGGRNGGGQGAEVPEREREREKGLVRRGVGVAVLI